MISHAYFLKSHELYQAYRNAPINRKIIGKLIGKLSVIDRILYGNGQNNQSYEVVTEILTFY